MMVNIYLLRELFVIIFSVVGTLSDDSRYNEKLLNVNLLVWRIPIGNYQIKDSTVAGTPGK